MTFKLICSDIDGTLLNRERNLSMRTVGVIAQLRDTIHVILASSRMPSAMKYLQKELQITDMPLICYNGAYVINGVGEVVTSEYVPIEVLDDLLALGVNKECNISLYSEDRWFAEREDNWTLREIHNTRVQPIYSELKESIANLKREGKSAHKIMCMGQKDMIDDIHNSLSPHTEVLNLYRSKDTYLEISSNRLNKATALEKLLALYKPAIEWKEVISFGDNYNDIELLRASGIGVAVGNAKDKVIVAADAVTKSNIEDGVALELVRRFNNRS